MSSTLVSIAALGSVTNRSLGLTTATESARVTGPIKGKLGLGFETIAVEQVLAFETGEAGAISTEESTALVSNVASGAAGITNTGGSSAFVSNVASGTIWFLGLTTATVSARVTGPIKGVPGLIVSGGTVGEGLVTVVLAPDGNPPAAGVISTEGSSALVSNVASGAAGITNTEGSSALAPNVASGALIIVGVFVVVEVVGARVGASVVVTGARLVVGGRVFSGGKVVLGGGVAIIHI
tara:strand:+ start:1296 stop:2009 length:714 start_codon:yes stop_codon:yes gene_type:complete